MSNAGRPCEVSLYWDGKPPWCGEPAAWTITYGCVHEHVGKSFVCSECKPRMDYGGAATCVPCRKSAEPHHCEFSITWEPLEAVAA